MRVRCSGCRFSLVFAALLLAGAGFFAVFPWKAFVEGRVKAFLEAQGLRNVRLTVAESGLRRLTLRDLAWGERADGAPILSELTLDYSLRDLFFGHVDSLSVRDLFLQARQDGAQWTLGGQALPARGGSAGAPFVLPLTKEHVAAIPLGSARLEDSRLLATTETWKLDMPLRFSWQKKPSPQIGFFSGGADFKTREVEARTGEVDARAALDFESKTWTGSWTVKDMKISAGGTILLPLNGKGSLFVDEDQVRIDGVFDSEDSNTQATFRLVYFPADPKKSRLVLVRTAFPWNGGNIVAQDVVWHLAERRPTDLDLQLQGVSLDALLQQLTGKRASGTGLISGNLPVTIQTDGSLRVHDGKLSAEGPGVIRMSPDVIPGDNAQIALVRDVLKNLSFTFLAVDVEGKGEKGLVVRLKVEGRNHDLAGARPVKMNVQLTGDLLDFVRQNTLLFNDPRKLLEQNEHAKP